MTIYDLNKGSEIEKIELPLSVALGNFDGLHLGHMSLIERAKCSELKSCVFTFSQNPFSEKRLISLREKKRILAEAGVDYLAVFDFEAVRDMSAEDFVEEILINTLKTQRAVCGYDFRFGKNALGSGQWLKDYLLKRERECVICEPVSKGGEVISSSRIRTLLSKGELEEAASLMGRPYSVYINVSHGNGIGRGLGYPTVNQVYNEKDIKLPYGVYICSCCGRPAVTNFGVRPTVTNDPTPYYESFILNYKADLYGAELKLEFHKMLRTEKKFSTTEELSARIALDVKQTEEYFK